MSFLLPGVGEEQEYPVERLLGYHMLHNLDRVVLDYPHITHCIGMDAVQAATNARIMNFDSQVQACQIVLRHHSSIWML